MYDYSSLFSPQRMQQGQQGVQGVNNMPWVYNNYLQQLLGMTGTQTPSATQTPAQVTPLQGLLGTQSLSPGATTTTDPNAQWWQYLLQNPGGGS